MNQELFNLPWTTLLTIASGYAGYYVANLGVREHHKTIDVAFSTLVFGFLATFVYRILLTVGANILASAIVAFLFAAMAGGIWSRYGRIFLLKVLRLSDVSHANDLPKAWVALFSQTGVNATQLSVKLKDGTWLKCEDLSHFQNMPNGPCVLGGSGDVLMYVTHQQNPNEEEFSSYEAVADPKWGNEITYIPADQIARLDFRRKMRVDSRRKKT